MIFQTGSGMNKSGSFIAIENKLYTDEKDILYASDLDIHIGCSSSESADKREQQLRFF
jgi:hypothetical protein